MTSNKDWLNTLAHEAPDELAVWMDAEHVDVDEPHDGDGSCGQDVDQGIRAEAPVRESCTNLDAQLDRKPTDAVREFAARYERRIEELEDELHRSYDAQSAKAEELTLRGVRIKELQEQVGKLTAERDGWRMRCGELLDAAHAMQGVADAWDEEV